MATEEIKKTLESLGGKYWPDGDSRIYFNDLARWLGFHNSGRPFNASLRGETISNSYEILERCRNTRLWFNTESNKFYARAASGGGEMLRTDEVNQIIEAIRNAVSATHNEGERDMDTNEVRAQLVGKNIKTETIDDIGDRWPVVERDGRIVDVLDASEDLSAYDLADLVDGQLVIRDGASDCLVRREA